MQFDLSDEQQALQDAIERLLRNSYGFERRRTIVASQCGHDEQVWRQIADMGVCGLVVAPEYGGYGGGASDLYPVMRAVGAALALEPVLVHAVMAPTALRAGADERARRHWLPGVASGELRVAWAHDEAGASAAVDGRPHVRAQCRDGRWLVDGHKPLVLHGTSASHWIVSAICEGGAPTESSTGLFMIERGAPGVSVQAGRLIDDTPIAVLRFERTPAAPLNTDDPGAGAVRAIEAVRRMGISAVCAEAVGTMETAHGLAVQYLGTRKQFGRLIGEYQVLRHRAADMLVSLELCRSMAMAAASAVDHPDGQDSELDLLRAKTSIGLHGRRLCEAAIQLHGGIGMTEEYAVGHCLRRMVAIDQLFEPSQAHRRALGHALAHPYSGL